MENEEAERLVQYLTAKHVRAAHRSPRGLSEVEVRGIVATTVADTLLVADGSLTVEDFNPDGHGLLLPHRQCECLDPIHQGEPCHNDANADDVIGGGKVRSSPALCTACAFSCDEFNGPRTVANDGL